MSDPFFFFPLGAVSLFSRCWWRSRRSAVVAARTKHLHACTKWHPRLLVRLRGRHGHISPFPPCHCVQTAQNKWLRVLYGDDESLSMVSLPEHTEQLQLLCLDLGPARIAFASVRRPKAWRDLDPQAASSPSVPAFPLLTCASYRRYSYFVTAYKAPTLSCTPTAGGSWTGEANRTGQDRTGPAVHGCENGAV
jgi:hypothetical protein